MLNEEDPQLNASYQTNDGRDEMRAIETTRTPTFAFARDY